MERRELLAGLFGAVGVTINMMNFSSEPGMKYLGLHQAIH